MKISFVLPCYNKVAYISDALKGLIHQSLKDIEIICVNDKSTDGTDEILEFYAKKDKRIKVKHLSKNGGMSNARNVGIEIAKAPVICAHDADDISHPDRAKLVSRFFDKNDVSLVYSGFWSIDELGHVTGEYKAIPFVEERLYTKFTTFMGHPTYAYRKKVILKYPYSGGQWSRLGCEDYKLILDLTRAGHKIGMIEELLMFYRQLNSASTCTRDEEKVLKLKKDYIRSMGVQ